jgi:hypothetical protein
MDSYTFGSHDFMMAVLEKGTKEKYPIELNATDFRVFVTILEKLSQYDSVNHHDIPTIPGYGEDGESEPIGDWATSWLSGIAETLGIEGI